MRPDIFDDDHKSYRATVRSFIQREIVPSYPSWEREGFTDPDMFAKAIAAGLYGLQIPERFGGPGVTDYRYRVIVSEEIARARATSVNVSLTNQDDMFLHYLLNLGTEQQLERWVPPLANGSAIGAVAMTEPGAGSDLRGIRTRAVRDGDDWILNGSKIFITHGIAARYVLVAARTGEKGMSLLMLEDGMPGFERSRRLDKLGLRAQDTAELSFTDVRVPVANTLGPEGTGLRQLMAHLERERLGTTLCAVADARAVYDLTVDYCATREAFGQPIGDFQASRLALAEMETEIELAELMMDTQVLAYNRGELTSLDAAKGKWWTTELQKKVIDRCVQLHGGYGFMMEYAVTRAYADARVQTIYGGTTEILKDLIGREIMRAKRA